MATIVKIRDLLENRDLAAEMAHQLSKRFEQEHDFPVRLRITHHRQEYVTLASVPLLAWPDEELCRKALEHAAKAEAQHLHMPEERWGSRVHDIAQRWRKLGQPVLATLDRQYADGILGPKEYMALRRTVESSVAALNDAETSLRNDHPGAFALKDDEIHSRLSHYRFNPGRLTGWNLTSN